MKTIFTSSHPLRRINLVFFGIFLILTGLLAFDLIDIKAHDDEWFLAWLMGLSAAVIFLPQLLVRFIRPLRRVATEQYVAWLEAMLILAMTLSWIGAFGPYRWGFGYDSFVHFGASLIIAVVLVATIYLLNPKWAKNSVTVFVMVIVFSILAGIGNEAFEKYGDIIWGTEMFGEAGQPNDTLIDYIYDFVGAVFGSVLGITYRKRILNLIKL